MSKNWIWTDHMEIQIAERELSKELVESVISDPDEIVPGKRGRSIYHKLIGSKLVRVVADGNVLITVYTTSRIEKYMKGKQR
jgi:hypothetical protein